VLGGLFAEYLTWTLIFWVNLPLGLLAIRMCDRGLRRLPVRGTSHHIDYLGSLLMVVATISFLLALTWGGHRYTWLSHSILGLLLLAVAFGCLFVWRQRVAREPILPLHVLANPVVCMAALIAMLLLMVNVSTAVYVPIYLELARGLSADQAGLVLIAPMIGVVVGAVISGQYMRFVGRYRLPPIVGTASAAVSLWCLGRGVESLSPAEVVLLLAVVGTGLGSGMPPMLVATQNAASPRDLGIATGSHAFFRSLGGAIGVALFSATILGSIGGHLTMIAGASSAGSVDLDELLHQGAVTQAALPYLNHAFTLFFELAAAVTSAACCGLLLLKEIPLRQHPAASAPADVPAE
jgi:MFS family permease